MAVGFVNGQLEAKRFMVGEGCTSASEELVSTLMTLPEELVLPESPDINRPLPGPFCLELG